MKGDENIDPEKYSFVVNNIIFFTIVLIGCAAFFGSVSFVLSKLDGWISINLLVLASLVFLFVMNKTVDKISTKLTKYAYKHKAKPTRNIKKSSLIYHLDPSKKIWDIKLINELNWILFEKLCYLYFETKGYEATLTEKGADGGVDIKLFKDDLWAVVQCKHWKKRIDVNLVRELFGVMHTYNATKSIFVTSSYFTSVAQQYARENNIQLISGEQLLVRIKALPLTHQELMLAEITKIPECPTCKIKMVSRDSNRNQRKYFFWGCENFPKCRETVNII